MRVKIMAESADHNLKSENEWPYLVQAEDITGATQRYEIVPNAEQVKNLCRRLNIVDIRMLEAKITLKRENKRVIHVNGLFSAHVVQSCITTLQPVEDHIEDTFEAWYADPEQAVSFARARHERDKEQAEQERQMLEEHEDPEPIIDGQIDLGELVTQYLSLAINPYPQSKHAQKELEEVNDALPAKENPFAALKGLKDQK